MKIRVIAAVLDTQCLLLYKENGETVTIPQGDSRIRPILDSITPIISRGEVATVDLEGSNEYVEFEKQTNGLVRFFRIAKEKVFHLFSTEEERIARNEPTAKITMTIGEVPPLALEQPVSEVKEPTEPPKTPTATAIDQIMAHAEPTSSEKFSEDKQEDQTVVAVVGSGKDAKVVPGVEAIKDQLTYSNKLGSPEGITNLLTRLGKEIDKRGHSVQDVLRFLEKGDLPIADDGSIIAYKVLARHPKEKDTFVDCHTRKIPQKVGSFVQVAENLVDRDRRNECSNGLHIARRGYIRNFSGDICVLTKIDPADVITVPHGDPNKVRVCGYHIIGLLSEDAYRKLRENRPMTDIPEAQALLQKAINGNHVDRLEVVLVTGQLGTKYEITSLVNVETIHEKIEAPKAPAPKLLPGQKPPTPPPTPKKAKKKAKPTSAKVTPKFAPKAKALDDPTVEHLAAIDPKKVSEQVVEAKAEATSNRKQLVAQLVTTIKNADLGLLKRKEAYSQLLDIKKKAKVSWEALGTTGAIEVMGNDLLATPIKSPAKSIKQEKPTPPPLVKTAEGSLQPNQKKAIAMFKEGKHTKVEISKATNIPSRSLGRLLDKFGK